MDMIEKVARALAEFEPSPGLDDTQWAAWIDKYWPAYADQARAAIEAMREPTEEMVRAGLTSLAVTAVGLPEFEPKDEAELCFTAMIDAALTGGK